MANNAEHLAGLNGHIGGMQRGDRPAAYLIRLLYLVKYNHGQRLVGAALKTGDYSPFGWQTRIPE
ncbi:MAG: hypothetical protein VX555_02520 [Pseudomonadota bacterium]|nr:hypothetical protein [Pseudomonadota bacterium]